MDRFQLVVGNESRRLEGNSMLAEGRLLEGRGTAGAFSRAAAAARSFGNGHRFGRLQTLVHAHTSQASDLAANIKPGQPPR
jgi:hypothetical protein